MINVKLPNPFKLQNWKFSKFLLIIIGIQLSLLGVFALNDLGITTPILRPIVGFIYLSFIPGYLLLRILRMHNLSSIESFLYALGLSLSADMITGFLINTLYPILRITNKPIHEHYIILTMAGVIFLLCIVAYFRDNKYANYDFIHLKNLLCPQFLFLSLIPFMSIFGTHAINYQHTNILLIIMIMVIALIALLLGLTKLIPKELYPYSIWIMAISLIYHTTLFTKYILVQDVYSEYYISNIVISNHIWAWHNYIFVGGNSVLTNAVITPFIHFICDITLTSIYKIVYPIYLSFIPLGIYSISSQYLNNIKKGLLSAYLFIIIQPFFMVVPFLSKQIVAEIYLLLIIHSILNRHKILLFIILGLSQIMAHYGTTYLTMFMLVTVALMLKVIDIIKRENINNNFIGSFTILYVIFTLSWYMYVANSYSFAVFVGIGNSIITAIFSEFLNPTYTRGAYLLTKPQPLLGTIIKYTYLIITGFILIGYSKTLLHRTYKIDYQKLVYILLSTYWIVILGAAVSIPFFAVMNPYRIYHLAFFILTPFAVEGVIFIFKIFSNIIGKSMLSYDDKILKILMVFFTIFMILNTEVLGEILHQPPYSRYLSQNTILKQGCIDETGKYYAGIITDYDMYSSKWLSKYRNLNYGIHATVGWGQGFAVLMAYGDISDKDIVWIHNYTNNISPGYIYLYYFNVVERIGMDNDPQAKYIFYYNISKFDPLFNPRSKIYDNGGSHILI
jgi:uncharacterized membrane protein